MTEEELEDKWEKKWQEHWRPLLFTNGILDEDKIKNEMHDLVHIYEQVAEVYEAVSGGKLSKPMYYAKTIIDLYHEQLQKAYHEGEHYDDHSRTQRHEE